MTPDERNLLQPFLQDLAQARGAAKDPEADAMISQAIRDNPDAVYLLVQHALLSDQALHAAQAQIQQMQNEVSGQGQGGGSFLGGGQAPAPYAGPSYDPPAYAPPSYAQPQQPYGGYSQGAAPLQSNPMSSSGGLHGFLRTAGTMAAGVAAGDFLANGLSNLFGGGGRDW